MSEIPMASDALRLMRMALRFKQENLARALGIAPSQLSNFENGADEPPLPLVERAAVAMGLSRAAVPRTLVWLEQLRADVAAPAPGGAGAADARQERVRIAAEIGHLAAGAALASLDRLDRALVLYEDRRRAQLLWEQLQLEEPESRRALVREEEAYHTWALAELLWKKSLAAAANDAREAVHLGDLAVQVAERAPGDPEWQAGTRAQAHGHHGNALRVLGDHAAAERACEAARRHWLQGGDKCPELGSEARLLGFEASLRRAQRRFGEAQILLDRALARDRGDLTPNLLLKKAKLLRDRGDIEEAVEALQVAEPFLGPASGSEPRLVFAARCNLVYYLSLLERYEEAASRLPEAWRLAEPAAGELDRLRLVWVSGRVAAGTGRRDEGTAALEQVRRDLAARGMDYDSALAALELAALHLEQGDTARVRALVNEMLPAFESREIHREALAALRLFRQAVEKERATVALVRHLVAYLHRARHNPELRFEPLPGGEAASGPGPNRKERPSGSRRKGP